MKTLDFIEHIDCISIWHLSCKTHENMSDQNKMKSLVKLLIVTFIISTSLTSCRKDVEQLKPDPTVGSTNAKTIAELKAPAVFNWNTSNLVSFSLKGINGDVRKSTLKITTPTNAVIFQKLQNLSDSYSGIIEVPSFTKSVIVSFNGVSTTYDITSCKIEASVK